MSTGRRLVKVFALPLCVIVLLHLLYYRKLLYLIVGSNTFHLAEKPLTAAAAATSNPTTGPVSHIYRDDGLLELNPDSTHHPIFELIEQAEERWRHKLARASKTLDQAVQEYKRRYNRHPPKGFDIWWNYTEAHSVQLRDEYDQIWHDLEPFWAIRPEELQKLQAQQEYKPDSYTIGKTTHNDTIRLLKTAFSDPVDWEKKNLLRGADDLIGLLRDVQGGLPPFRAVVSPHDNPMLLSDYEIKKKLLDAASKGKYVNVDSLQPGERLSWFSACAPSSPARQAAVANHTAPSNRKRFIHDHKKTMDPCVHPHLIEQHGQFLTHEPIASRLVVPQFAYCSTALHHDIQAPALLSWIPDILPRSDDPPWDAKPDIRLSWRGSNTGIWHAPESRWRDAQRARLVDLTKDMRGAVEVLMNESVERGERLVVRTLDKNLVNPAMLDVAFAGSPVGCPPEFCEQLTEIFEWRRRQGAKEAGTFKYVLDVDGNAWSSRFKRLMTSNSLILKATIYPEWFLDRVEPWVHYAPVQVDYSDLYDVLVFFRGGLYGEGAHEKLAKKIASEGRAWSKSFWRKEDLTAYLFRLFLEYARVMSLKRESMNYEHQAG